MSDEKTVLRFHGEPEENYAEFKAAAQFELSLIDSDKRLTGLNRMLGIKPKVALSHNIPLSGSFTTPAEIWAVLDSTFANEAEAEQAAAELESFKQRSLSLPEFNYRFETLCGKAGVTGTFKAQMYQNKLVSGLADRVRTSGASTYAAMKKQAAISAPDANRDYQRSLKEREKKKARNDKGTTGRNAKFDKPITCWNCEKEGHISAKCPEPRKERKTRKSNKTAEQSEEEDLDGQDEPMRRASRCQPSGKARGRIVPTNDEADFIEL